MNSGKIIFRILIGYIKNIDRNFDYFLKKSYSLITQNIYINHTLDGFCPKHFSINGEGGFGMGKRYDKKSKP